MKITSHTDDPKQATARQTSDLFSCVVAQHGRAQLPLLHVLPVDAAQAQKTHNAFGSR